MPMINAKSARCGLEAPANSLNYTSFAGLYSKCVSVKYAPATRHAELKFSLRIGSLTLLGLMAIMSTAKWLICTQVPPLPLGGRLQQC